MKIGSYELKIALRFLIKGKNQTILILLGIAVGVAVQFFLSSLISGLQISLIQSTVGNSSHIRVLPSDNVPLPLNPSNDKLKASRAPLYSERSEILSWQEYLEYFRKIAGVTAAAAVIDGSGSVERGSAAIPVLIKGVVPEDGFKIYKVLNNLVSGSVNISGDDVLIGKVLSERFVLGPGDRFFLRGSQGNGLVCAIRGVFDLGSDAANNIVFMRLDRARDLFGLNGVSAVEVQIADVFSADRIVSENKGSFSRVKLESWQEKNRQLLAALRSQSSSSDIINFFVLFSITLGIASVLGISAMQKSRQLGILKAMGTTDLSAALIFLFQGCILGIFGALLGISMGFGLVSLFENSVGRMLTFSFDVSLSKILSPAILAIIASAVAAVLPARRAAKLSPIEVIRYG
jgi:lipoprotein-releasing system permease protein